jgi:hypothetical protein
MRGFVRTNEDGRWADRRLANLCLQGARFQKRRHEAAKRHQPEPTRTGVPGRPHRGQGCRRSRSGTDWGDKIATIQPRAPPGTFATLRLCGCRTGAHSSWLSTQRIRIDSHDRRAQDISPLAGRTPVTANTATSGIPRLKSLRLSQLERCARRRRHRSSLQPTGRPPETQTSGDS